MLGRFTFKAMGCPCALHLHAPTRSQLDRAAERAQALVLELEHKYSRYRDDSVLSAINKSAGDPVGVLVDDETALLLDYADTAHRHSGGLFDATSGTLRRVWDFRSGRLPSEEQVRLALRCVGWAKLRWERPRVVLPVAGMELDFGGFVKEYAVDRVTDLCRELGVRHGLVDLGGDLRAIGPHPDGRPWLVGIRDPRAPDRAIATVSLRSEALATSGDYERCMVVDGVRYSHILDPRTGWPVSGLASASVVAEQCLVAGTATTVALLSGERGGARFLDGLGLPSLRVDSRGRLSGSLTPSGASSGRFAGGDRPGRAA